MLNLTSRNQSKLVVLKSLLCFLSTALSPGSVGSPAQNSSLGLVAQDSPYASFMSSSFRSSGAFSSFDALLQPKTSEQKTAEAYLWKESADDEYSENPLIAGSFALDGIQSSWSIGDLSDLESLSPLAGDQIAESSRGVRPETAYVIVSRIVVSAQGHGQRLFSIYYEPCIPF